MSFELLSLALSRKLAVSWSNNRNIETTLSRHTVRSTSPVQKNLKQRACEHPATKKRISCSLAARLGRYVQK